MAQYIDNANQEILWKTFHKIPNVNNMDYGRKEQLFKHAISHIYHSSNGVNINKEQLHDLNRQTMKILLDNVSPVKRSKEETTQQIFEDKQKQYDKMTEKPNMPKPAGLFQEPDLMEEGAISNMNERIEAYQKQREMDMPTIPLQLLSKQVESVVKQEKDTLQSILESVQRIESRIQLYIDSTKI
jgi:hypothetical protein